MVLTRSQYQTQVTDIYLDIDDMYFPKKQKIEFKGVERQREQEKGKKKTNKKKDNK